MFVNLLIVQGALAGAPPKADDPTSKITAYFTDHRSRVLASMYVGGLALVFFLWFLGSLRDGLTRAEKGTGRLAAVTFGAGVAIAALSAAMTAVQTTLAFKAAGAGDAAIIRAFFDLSNMLGTFLLFPAVVFLLAASAVMIRTGAIARWLGWAGLVNAVVQIIAAAALFTDSGPLAAGGAFGFIAFILALLWILAVSSLLVMRYGKIAPATA